MAIDLTVRFSELQTLMRCQLAYKLQYASGLSSPPNDKMVQGSAFHALMQGHYESFRETDARKQPRDLAAARFQGAQRLKEYRQGEGLNRVNEDMLELLRWQYAGYVERFGTDNEFDRIVVVDEKRVVPLVTYKGVKVSLKVTADLIVHHAKWDRWILLDHKGRGGVDASKEAFKKENQLDPQRALYAASYSMQGPKKGRIPIFAAYHNVVRSDKLKRDMTLEERFARSPIFYNQIELAAVWDDAKTLAKRAVEIRLGVGPKIYSSPDPLTCNWSCGFTQIHLTSRATGRDIVQVALDYGITRDSSWRPLINKPEPVETSEDHH